MKSYAKELLALLRKIEFQREAQAPEVRHVYMEGDHSVEAVLRCTDAELAAFATVQP